MWKKFPAWRSFQKRLIPGIWRYIRYELIDGLNPDNGFEKQNARFTSSFGLQFKKLCWFLIQYWDQSFFISPRQILQHHPSRSHWTVESKSFQIIYWFVHNGFKAFWTESKNSDLRKLFFIFWKCFFGQIDHLKILLICINLILFK